MSPAGPQLSTHGERPLRARIRSPSDTAGPASAPPGSDRGRKGTATDATEPSRRAQNRASCTAALARYAAARVAAGPANQEAALRV